MRKITYIAFLFIFVVLVLFVAHLFSGSVAMSFFDVLQALLKQSNPFFNKIVELRLLNAVSAVLAGISLSVAGLAMQTFFRNPIAGPFVLGISAGSSLGVALVVMAGSALGVQLIYVQGGISLAALAGAFLFTLLILVLAQRINNNSSLLIIGLMLGSAVSALVSLLQFFSDKSSLKNFVIWSFGTFKDTNWGGALIMAVMAVLGIGIMIVLSKNLNAFLIGEDNAKSLGISVSQTKWLLIIACSLLTAGVTAFCGPLAFIGIAVPHLAKNLLKTSKHLPLIIYSIILGALVCLACSLLANMPLLGRSLPINIVTSLIGAPFVIYIIFKNSGFTADV